MPSASFYANFDQFDRQVEAAKQTLGNFEISCRNVQGSVSRIATAYDGSKLIGEAVKTAAAIEKIAEKGGLTEAELRKLNARFDEAADKARRVGQDMPAAFTKVADSVKAQLAPMDAWDKANQKHATGVKAMVGSYVAGLATWDIAKGALTGVANAMVGAGQRTIALADTLSNLSAKSGMSVEGLQQLRYGMTLSGVSMETVTNAATEMGRRLADGDASALGALKKLGIEVGAFKQLQPDQQILAVNAALREMKSPGEQASTLIALFGRAGKEVLPAMKQDLRELAAEAREMGAVLDEETVGAIDHLGDRIDALTMAGEGLLARFMRPFLESLDELASKTPGGGSIGLGTWAEAFGRLSLQGGLGPAAGFMMPGNLGAISEREYLTSWWSTYQQTVQKGGPNLAGQPFSVAAPSAEELSRLNAEIRETTSSLGRGRRATDASARAEAAREAALVRYTAAFSAATATIQRLPLGAGTTLFGSGNTVGGLVPTFGAAGVFSPAGTFGRAGNPQNPYASLFGGGVIGSPPPAVLSGVFPEFNLWGGSGQITPAMGDPNISYSHLMPGGFNWSQAGAAGLMSAMPFLSQLVTGGSRGGQIGGSIAGSFGGALGSMSSVAGALGSFAPFLGPVAGLLGGLIGNLFGPSRGAVLGKEADQRMDQTRAGLLQQYGSLEAIAATGRAGQELVAGWGSKNVQGEAHFNNLVRAFEQQNQLLGEQAGVQSQIAGLEAQRAALNDSLVTSWDRVVEISTRYGISLEGLGAQVRQLGATTTWTQMLNDLEALTRAGGDVGGVLVGMKDEISAMVNESLRVGTEVPENWRRYIQNLAETGQLLDANGQAITDLSLIKWGPAVQSQADIAAAAMTKLDEAMERLVARLEEIVNLLANGLPDAAEQGARGANGAISTIEGPDMRGGGAEESFAGGSHGIQDFGAGTLAMLHGREIVQTEAQYRASQSGVITASQVVIDRRVLGEIIFELLPAAAARRGLVPGMAY